MTATPDAMRRAARIWCKPYMASKEMDTTLAELIAAEIDDAVKEAELRWKVNPLVLTDAEDIRARSKAETGTYQVDDEYSC